jgi:soluble lytic murein transglycosylase-like protein
VEQWRTLVARYFPADAVDAALSVMRKESGGDPSAVNSSSGCAGLFQLSHHHGTMQQRLDPAYNVATAARLHAAGGWSAWSVRP